MPRALDLQGRRFGQLRVLGLAPRAAHPRGLRSWLCRCDCGEVEAIVTSSLTHTRRCCLGCAGRAHHDRAVERTCIACGGRFVGDARAITCSHECREARRRGLSAGVDALPPPIVACVVCGRSYHTRRGVPRCCSAECRRERRRVRALESWYRRLARDPDLAKRMNDRRRDRAAADPEYAATVRRWERTRQANHRARMRSDPAYADRHRARARDLYARYAPAIRARRRARLDALPPPELAAWLERARRYGRRHARKFREGLQSDPDRHREYLDLMAEYRRQRRRALAAAGLIGAAPEEPE